MPTRKETKTLARYFAFGVILLPIVEIALFIKVGQTIGLFPTLALVIASTIVGSMVLRLQGVSVINQLRGNVAAGRLPAKAIADTMMMGLAGLLLILPGFFTSFLGLLLLLPPVRSWIYGGLASRVTVVNSAQYSSYRSDNDPAIRGQGTIDLDQDDYRPKD
ncbi:hypothetical protein WH87_18580 [Devosia epidermidihirudinis]|uniref:Exclusion suppressor FxsA n=1 Tax=Devosia epidermidihirudinis TaxID=1293439 RepID=A0A0F5Q2N9_9HYPH|nr:hypothetical protein WH87_18580 [Devosia epidermidihirudinis]